MTQALRNSATNVCDVNALVRTQRQLPGRSGGVAVDHVEGSAPFGMAIGLRKATLHNQAGAVLHQRMADRAQHRRGAMGFFVEPSVRIGGGGIGGDGRLLTPEVDLDIAVMMVWAGIGLVSVVLS